VLERELCLGHVGAGLVGHVVYLVVMVLVGVAVATRRLGRTLLR
jgi:lipooligosaccharide transport system permease protein